MSWWSKNEKPEKEPAPTSQTTRFGDPGAAVAERLVATAPPGWDTIQLTALNLGVGHLRLQTETVTAGVPAQVSSDSQIQFDLFDWLEALTAAGEEQWTQLTVTVAADLSFHVDFSYEPLPADVD